jgi:acetyltransferase-like isoleucine patch superfamily enzyme
MPGTATRSEQGETNPSSPTVEPSPPSSGLAPRLRFAWAILSSFVVESVVFGVAILPAVLFWRLHFAWPFGGEWLRIVVISMSFIPAYLLFTFMLMVLSAGSTRLLGWRTPPDAQMKISEYGWPLLNWARYMVSTHLVRIFAGTLFRATPVWTFYMRLNGAKLGRGVYVNSLSVNDHCLLEFGDHVVIGEYAHLSGHTVERGYVKTARVRLGSHVTIGLESVIGIGVEIGDHTQVGALSLVRKHTRLPGGATYVGIPVRRVDPEAAGTAATGRATGSPHPLLDRFLGLR